MVNVCEVCLSQGSGNVLDLGFHPLCDDMSRIGSDHETLKFHQEIWLCPKCLTAHQLHQVEKTSLFKSDYRYRAGLTKDVLSGMQELVDRVAELELNTGTPTILDIGCNDGSLLGLFKAARDCITLGVDPTDAIKDGSSSIDFVNQNYFNLDVANSILSEHGQPDVITFTNVFAHIEDLQSLIAALSILLSETTYLVIENHYLGSIIEKQQFDTFYHEHPRTYSVHSFVHIAKSLKLNIHSIEFPKRYGGNIRVIMSKSSLTNQTNLTVQLNDEREFDARFASMQGFYDNWLNESKQTLLQEFSGVSYVGKSLPGRAVMLISALGLDESSMPFVFEQPKSPKIGHYVPGTTIQIKSDAELMDLRPERIVVWAWHIIEEVTQYLENRGYKGEVWIPLPEFKLYRKL